MEYDPHQLWKDHLDGVCHRVRSAFIYVPAILLCRAAVGGGSRRSQSQGLSGPEHLRKRGEAGGGCPSRRRRVRVRRGDGVAKLARRLPRPASAQATLPRGRGLYRQPTIITTSRRFPTFRTSCGMAWTGTSSGHATSTGFRVFCLRVRSTTRPLRAAAWHTLRELIYDYGGGITAEAGELKP